MEDHYWWSCWVPMTPELQKAMDDYAELRRKEIAQLQPPEPVMVDGIPVYVWK